MNTQARRKRRRAALSCVTCRRRKVKCDRTQPCVNCKLHNTLCVYHEFHSNEDTDASLVEDSIVDNAYAPAPAQSRSPSVQIVLSTGDIAQTIPTASSASTSAPYVAPFGGRSEAIEQTSTSHGTTTAEVLELRQRIQALEKQSRTGSSQRTNQDAFVLRPALHDTHLTLNKTRLINWSTWAYSNGELNLIKRCYAGVLGDPSVKEYDETRIRPILREIGTLMQQCKAFEKVLKSNRPSRSLVIALDIVLPAKHIMDRNIEAYFIYFETTHRILHRMTFEHQYRKYWDDPNDQSLIVKMEIALVVAIGSSVLSEYALDADWQSTVSQWGFVVETWLAGPLLKQRLTMSSLQLNCLLLLARQVFPSGGDLIWISCGTLVHRAMQMGYHRDPKYFPKMNVLESEMRRRLWATVMELSLQAASDSAMPLRITEDEYDTERPMNIYDLDLWNSPDSATASPVDQPTDTSLQLILLDSLPCRMQVLKLLNTLDSKLSYMEVLDLGNKILDTRKAYTELLDSSVSSGNFSLAKFHHKLLDYLIYRFIIPLHGQFASEARTNPLFHYSLTLSLDAACSLCSRSSSEQFETLMKIAGGFFRDTYRSSMAVISLELLTRAGKQNHSLASGITPGSQATLKSIMRDTIELARERIDAGETNVKHHMVFSMILAQVEAMEGKSSAPYEIARSARDSLTLCHGILESKARVLSPTVDQLGQPEYLDGILGDAQFQANLDFLMSDNSFLW